MEPLLSIRRLHKKLADRPLFDIGAFAILPACAYVLTGSNGVGKSTLLRILAGLDSAEIEDARFCGESVRMVPYPRSMRESVVYMHQHPIMFSTSVADNIGYGLRVRGMQKNRISERVDEAMSWAGVTQLRDSNPATLSGGEKQRVALARAKVLSPKLLLLDEPTSNLDGTAREQVIALVPDLAAAGCSIIVACHDRDLIALPGIHRLKLRDGRLHVRRPALRVHVA